MMRFVKQYAAKNHILKKSLSMFIVFALLFGMIIPFSAAAAEDEEESPADGGFTVSLNWRGNVSDPEHYEYDSSAIETRYIRLNVSYKNDKLLSDYGKGQIVITVPGINDAERNGIITPVAIAADKASETDKIYDWSYTYNSSTGLYTFTNNEKSFKNNVYDGMFEIVWAIKSESSVDGYNKTLQATLRTINGEVAQSNEVTYSQTREKFTYLLTPKSDKNNGYNPASKIFSAEGLHNLIDEEKSAADYTFVKYSNFLYTYTKKARSLLKHSYNNSNSPLTADWKIWAPVGTNICGSDGVVGEGSAYQKTGETKTINGTQYAAWETKSKTIYLYSMQNPSLVFYAAYPNDSYWEKDVSIYLEGYGQYKDEDEDVMFAEQVYTINTSDYSFLNEGEDYGIDIINYGIQNSYTRNHCTDCFNYGAVDASDISNAKRKYSSDMVFTYNRSEVNSFEIGQDIFQVLTTDNTYRFLSDDEYHYTSVTIPSMSGLYNINGFTVQPKEYDAEIYVRRAGKSDYELYPTKGLKFDSNSHTVNFTYTDVVAVSVKLKELDQSFQRIYISCNYQFHSNKKDILLDQGLIRHYMFVKRYDADGNLQNDVGNGSLPQDEEMFGVPVLRNADSIHVLIIPNILSADTYFSSVSHTSTQYQFDGCIYDTFQIPDGNSIRAFTVYAIIPDGLTLQEKYNTVDKLLDKMKITGLSKTESFLKEHLIIQILHRTDSSGKERTYLEMKFDFGEDAIVNTDSSTKSYYLRIDGIPMAVNIDEINQRSGSNLDPRTYSFTLRTMTTIDQTDFWYTSYTDDMLVEGGLWSDIDGDGVTDEMIAYDANSTSFTIAGYAQLESVMSVKTDLSNGYVKPEFDDETETFTDVPETYGNSTYAYRIKFRGNKNTVCNIVAVNPLEADTLSEWQGTFLSIDTAKAAEFTGVTPTVYYAETVVDANNLPDFTDTDTWKVLPDDLSDWTAEQRSAVKTIAVDFNKATLIEGEYIFFDIYMTSPDNQMGDISSKKTVNSSVVWFNPIDELTGDVLPSTAQSTRKVAVTITPFKGTVKIVKQDKEDSSILLPGVVFDLYRKEDDSLIQENITTNSEGVAEVREIPYGEYYLVEKSTAKGYVLSDKPFEFELSSPYPDCVTTVTIENVREITYVTLKKVCDKDTSLGLAGAKFRIHTENGDYFSEAVYTTDQNGDLTITGIPWGTYYLEEIQPPAGYEITEAARHIEFTVNAENNAGRELNLKAVNNQIPGRVIMQKYEMLNDGSLSETPLSNAFYELYNANGRLLGTYLTDSNGIIEVDDLDFGDYYFLETVPSTGYLLYSDKISFTIDGNDLQTDGTVVHYITTYDQRKPGSVWLEKKDDQGDFVKGAVYGLFRQSDNARVNIHGEIIENSFSTDGLFVTDDLGSLIVEDIWWGDYYMKEVTAPTGYQLSNEIYQFSINKNTVRSTIRLKAADDRLTGTVRLIKVNKDDNTQRLSGAVYGLYQSDGNQVRTGITTGDDGTAMIENIPWGTYYLQEEKAPAGFDLSDEKIRFTVNYISAGKVQEITVEDKQAIGEIKIKKRISLDNVAFAHGNPTFLFKISGTNSVTGATYTAYKSVTFAEDYVNSLKNTENIEYAEMTILFSDVPTGECKVSEVEVQRYEVSDISDITSNGVLNEEDNSVTFTITDENLKCEVIFTNNKSVQSYASHTAAEVNMLKKSRKVTSLSAVWTGDAFYTDTMLDRSLLDVYIIYDDGTSEKLEDNAYELWSGEQQLSQEGVNDFDPATTMTTTIEVRYTHSGRTYTDSFNLTIVAMLPFTHKILDNTPFSEDGVQYAGTVAITGYLGDSTYVSIPQKVIGERTLLNNSTGAYEDHVSANVYRVVGVESITSAAAYGFKEVQNVNLPSTVKEIGAYTFYNNTALTDINLDGVEELAKYSFYGCTSLLGVELLSAKYIGGYVFYNCTSLSEIKIGDSIEEVFPYAFSNTAFYTNAENGLIYIGDKVLYGYKGSKPAGEVNIADSTICIADSALNGCTEITNVIIPNSMKHIGNGAFYGCTGLTELTIPENMLTIGGYAFNGCSGLTGTLTIPDSITKLGYGYSSNYGNAESGTGSSFYNCNKVSEVILGEGITIIAPYSFGNCSLLENVTFGNNITAIKNYAFINCSVLNEAVIPDSVTIIENYAFYNCKGLKNLVIGNGVTSIGNRAFYRCGGQEPDDEPLYLTLGSSVRTIGDYAFYECKNLRGNGGISGDQLIFPDSLTTIGKYAFASCNLGTVKLPDSVTSIGEYAFSKSDIVIPTSKLPLGVTCIEKGTFAGSSLGNYFIIDSSITNIKEDAFCDEIGLLEILIENGVTHIGGNAFGKTGLVDSVFIPKSVTSIDYNPFPGCWNLKAIEVDSDNPSYISVDGVLYTKDMKTLVCYPAGKSLDGFVIPSTVTEIGKYAFSGCDVSGFTLPDTITSIPDYAFYGCTGMTEFNIGSNIVSIGISAFEGCTGLTEISIPDSVTTIGRRVFAGCTGLTDVSIGNGLTLISDEAFIECTGLTEITIPDSVISIGDGAFYNCTNLSDVIIGSGVEYIGGSAFENCEGLTEITIPDSVISIGDGAFYNCTNLSDVIIGSGVEYIGGSAFENCEGLTEITIPDSVIEIRNNVFYNCTNLSDVTIGSGVKVIRSNAFCGCYLLEKVTIPSSVSYIENNVFSGCPQIEEVSIGAIIGNTKMSQIFPDAIGTIKTVTILDGALEICAQAFSGCSSLENITISNSVMYANTNSFSGVSTIKTVKIGDLLSYDSSGSPSGTNYWTMQKLFPQSYTKITSVEILDGLGNIYTNAFANCTSLTDVTVCDSIISVASTAFTNTALVNNAPNGPIYIDGKILYSFKGAKPTGAFEIQEGTLCIADQAFYGSSGLTSVTIPDSVQGVGYRAFYNCSGLGSVTFASMKNMIRFGSECFTNGGRFLSNGSLTSSGVTNGQIIYDNNIYTYIVAQDGTMVLYGCRTTPSGVLNVLDGTVCIAESAFNSRTAITGLVLPDSVKSIGWQAFNGCTGLKSIDFGNGLVNIGENAFFNCRNSNLTSLVIPDSVEVIRRNAFYGCTTITSLTLGNSVNFIGNYAFYQVKMTSLTIPDSVKTIGDQAFANNSSMKNLTIGNGVNVIARKAFINSNALTSLMIGKSVVSIGQEAFSGAGQKGPINGDIILPLSLSYVGDKAFTNCKYTGVAYVPFDFYYKGLPSLSGNRIYYMRERELP
ncbi:MAG: leucine-rich repeat protein [Acutalibacteraceae bacterium]